ncbi:hypothetical protein Slu03_02350 [Sediminihabitans luteus]|uniref:OmpA family protein n=1 Tax=Sediminihabitans luteus TaxID=1138585 RepID=UPI000C23F7CA|nr:OmpA family protein [Sediminihabitans luteus]GII97857.1 hypothetical protein Slu03_02350 [Sediminihabitans luteus]
MPSRGTATLALLAVVLVAAPAAPAGADDGGIDLAHGTVLVDGTEVPLQGRFAYPTFGLAEDPVIRGVVHGVYRVDGATALYYSLGEDTVGMGFGEANPFPSDIQEASVYGYNMASSVELVDVGTLQGFRPLVVDGQALTSSSTDLEAGPGQLVVAWALFPELPEGTTTVDVQIGRGAVVADVPVGDGALAPVVPEAAPVLGTGWPALAPSDQVGAADPAASTFDLARRTSDVEGVAQSAETAEEVEVTLDANVLFDKGSATLSSAARSTLDDVAADIAARGTGTVVITGHTDSDGSDADNQVLSEDRADAVLSVLEPASGDAVTFTTAGKGESAPVASNATPEGQQANRRVTVVYSVQGDAR